jgi:hypothetical protein
MIASSPIGAIAAFNGGEGRALHDRNVVAREAVRDSSSRTSISTRSSSSCVVDHVDLVHEHDQRRNADLTGEQDVLARLRHRAVGGGHDQDRAVHLSGARDHVLHVVGVAGAIDVRVVTVSRLVLDVRGVDRDAAGLFFRRGVDVGVRHSLRAALLGQNHRDGCCERRLAVVDVTNRADIAVRLVPLKLFLGHL